MIVINIHFLFLVKFYLECESSMGEGLWASGVGDLEAERTVASHPCKLLTSLPPLPPAPAHPSRGCEAALEERVRPSPAVDVRLPDVCVGAAVPSVSPGSMFLTPSSSHPVPCFQVGLSPTIPVSYCPRPDPADTRWSLPLSLKHSSLGYTPNNSRFWGRGS